MRDMSRINRGIWEDLEGKSTAEAGGGTGTKKLQKA